MQTRWGSFIEAVVNIVIGFIVAISAQMVIFPMFGIYTSTQEHLLIGLCFTAVSLVRSYLVRRFFNKIKSLQVTHG